jgi:hypothetical protein
MATAEEPADVYNPAYVKYIHNDQTFPEKYWEDPVRFKLPVCRRFAYVCAASESILM